MPWVVAFHDSFDREFERLPKEVQDEFYAEAAYLELRGPSTKRPHVDTLKGSAYAKMKELRFEAADGEWRAAFAFDPNRQTIVLCLKLSTF